MNELQNEKGPYFDRQTTNILKGIALIMMFVHHFYTFPDWWGTGISYPLMEKLAPYFCMPLKMCVSVFCFLTGYFYYYHRDKSYKYSLKKISNILISYWSVFFLFAAAAVVLVHYDYTVRGFLKECFAFDLPTMIFCWYVNFYIAFMLLSPLVSKIMSKNIVLDYLLSLFILPLLMRIAERHIDSSTLTQAVDVVASWYPMVLIGYIFANYGFFEKADNIIGRVIKSKVLCVALAVVALGVPMLRLVKPTVVLKISGLPTQYISMDFIYAPVFIYAVVVICRAIDVEFLKDILERIGKNSLLMWFVSCIFFANCKDVFQPILYFPHNPILVTLWGLVLCYSVSYALNILVKRMQDVVNHTFFA